MNPIKNSLRKTQLTFEKQPFGFQNPGPFKASFYNYRRKIIPIICTEFFVHFIVKNVNKVISQCN